MISAVKSTIEPDPTVKKLWKAAVEARKKAYAPYSKFLVGAALETSDGRVVTGCNVENASYGGTVCAERVATFKAVSDKPTKLKRVVVVAESQAKTPVPPCGFCLQVMAEFGTPKTEVWLASPKAIQARYLLSELLPVSFGSSDL